MTITERAILMCQLADHRDNLEHAVDTATIEYLRATNHAQRKLQTLRDAIDARDAMVNVQKSIIRSGQ